MKGIDDKHHRLTKNRKEKRTDLLNSAHWQIRLIESRSTKGK